MNKQEIEDYIRETITKYDLSLTDSDWGVTISNRMTTAHGKCAYKGSYCLIKISGHIIDNFDKEHVKGVIRHELAHAVAFLNHGERGESGLHFTNYLMEMDAPLKAPEPASEPRYIIECMDCGNEYGRRKKSKVVKYPHRYGCAECNGRLNRVK